MVSWYDGAAACAAQGKRLCWQSEWESACEGPEKLPFPYGLRRDPAQCNIDNPYVRPDLERVYSSRRVVQDAELLKLDQGVASGARPGCVSGFGVHDLTGNFDEWVNSEENKGKSQWAGLKGGAWGHVRNACRPMTTSHPPEFTYYFISFRCCADAAPDVEAAKDPTLWTPPPMPDHKPPGGVVSPGWTTTARGLNRPR
jgi:formylglycine-generating enzyme required for sulfatase activity